MTAHSEWTLVEQFALDVDLLPLLQHLTLLGVACHVSEADNKQQLFIRDNDKCAEVTTMIMQWQAGELTLLEKKPALYRPSRPRISKLALIKSLPMTLLAIVLGFVGAFLVQLDRASLYFAEPFLFQPLVHRNPLPVMMGLERGEYWRLITPMFIHFGIVHVVFNNLIIWLIGHRIEIGKSSGHLFLVLMITGLVANLTQFFLTPNTVFGGLSGAAYGLVGYIMVYQRLVDDPVVHFPTSMLIVLLLSLFLGLFGIFDLFMDNSGVANGAHVGGLLSGVMLGFIAAKMTQYSNNGNQ